MKTDIHPSNYRPVVFVDLASGEKFLISSTIEAEGETEFEGKTYPTVNIEISSASHPFYTGKETGGSKASRVKQFEARKLAAKK
jgi:large subunit ribosomal protein L31